MPRCVWDDIVGQPRVSTFLRAAVTGDRVSHAYLFVGPPGAGKETAAKALACAIFCHDDGCGACGTCTRVRRGSHPDVHMIEPEGAAGYLADQIRDVIHDASLSPIEGPYKLYIMRSADLFNDASANALLKTLEEPPGNVVFILTAHALDPVPSTIASRCQVVRFRRIPPSQAAALLTERTGADHAEALAALSAAGGVVARAADFLSSVSRREARTVILRTLGDLAEMDDLEVLNAAKELLVSVKAPLEDVKASHAAEAAEQSDFLGSSGMKSLEERQKRVLTSREREGVAEVLNVAESWLRDCLTVSQGVDDLVVNTDEMSSIRRMGSMMTPPAVARALGAVNESRKRISYNVSPQLAVEAMLFDIREVLRCPR